LMTMTRTSILDHSITLAAAALNIHAESSQIHLKISIPSEQSPKSLYIEIFIFFALAPIDSPFEPKSY
jgi:hypothetical protein